MATTDSRQGPGTLTLGVPPAPNGIEVSPQAATVTLAPTVNSSDGTPTLETPAPAPETSITWELAISAIQDFELDQGFVNFLMDHALAELPFEWTPITGGVVYSGTVQIVPIQVGGDVGVQTVSDVSLPVVGTPTRTAGGAAASASSKAKAAA